MSEHYIEFRNVSKAFDDNPVLKNVSFFVDQGETAVIMGRSGVGKSVSLKLLLGFLQPDDGQIIVAGQDVTFFTEEQFSEIRRIVTMVFQSGALFDSLTVAENVAFPFEARGARPDDEEVDRKVNDLLKALNLTEYADRLPSDLSMGTKRSVAIARALAEDPQAILYDEPTTMVDPLMAAHMSDLIVRLKKTLQKTSIVVTHDTHLAKKLADRVIFLAGRPRWILWNVERAGGFEGSGAPQFSRGRRIDSRAGRDRVSSPCRIQSQAKPASCDGLVGRTAVQHRNRAGTALDCVGSAQRHFLGDTLDSCCGLLFCAYRSGDCGAFNSLS